MPFADAKYPPPAHKPYAVVFGNFVGGFHVFGPFASQPEAIAWARCEGVHHGAVSGHSCWFVDLRDPASMNEEVICLD